MVKGTFLAVSYGIVGMSSELTSFQAPCIDKKIAETNTFWWLGISHDVEMKAKSVLPARTLVKYSEHSNRKLIKERIISPQTWRRIAVRFYGENIQGKIGDKLTNIVAVDHFTDWLSANIRSNPF